MHRFVVRLSLCLLALLLAVPAGAQPPATPDFDALSREAAEWLAGLIRIDTTNPPGNETAAARYLGKILEREGISAEVYESAPGRGIVIARLRSTAIADPARTLLLLGHTDVVGVEREKWTVNPFAGVVKDGYLWGRGALDMKGMVIANLAVMVALKRTGARLDRDVVFLAEGDEEAGGEHGINFAIREHWTKIAAGFAINEGGRVAVVHGQVQYVGVQAAEKVPVNVEVVATGPSGHASVPRGDNPVGHLATAIAKIFAYETPAKPNTITRRFFEGLAKVEDPEIAKWMRALETPERMPQAARRLSEANPVWGSMLRNSIAPTIVQGGIRSNVVPSSARATLNIRLLPGESAHALVEELKKVVNDPQITFEVGNPARQHAPPSSLESELYRAIERAGARMFPDTPVVPLMSTWATDSAQLRVRNVQAYGLSPFPLTAEEEARMHADDERIPLAAFRQGLEFLYGVVAEFVLPRAAAPAGAAAGMAVRP
jgi:acetylornithine deacetylase/succinyl-diaminopimelate desuccinylase-like protein